MYCNCNKFNNIDSIILSNKKNKLYCNKKKNENNFTGCILKNQIDCNKINIITKQLIANIDYINLDVGNQATINVIENDEYTDPIQNVIISAPPDLVNMGNAVVLLPNTNGIVEFTPAPRFLDDGFFGYEIESDNKTASSIVKINVNKTYTISPALLTVNVSNIINLFDINTSTLTPVITLNQNAIEIATNRGDVLLYYVAAGDTFTIRVCDIITGIEFTLLNVTISELGIVRQLRGIGFDNTRYFLYLGFLNMSTIYQVAVKPYDRYGNPGVQEYSATPITITLNGVPINDSINEITVQEETGYLYISAMPVNGINYFLYKVNPATGVIITSVNTGTRPIHVSFANNGKLYIIYNQIFELHEVNPTTLVIGPLLGTTQAITDLSELFYGM